MTVEQQQVLGRDDYLDTDQLETYVLERSTPDEVHLVTVPVGTAVGADGEVYSPAVTTSSSFQDAPTYDGPWNDPTLLIFPHSYTVVDRPTLAEWPDCTGRTVGEMRSRTYSQKLDESTGNDYYGLFKANVAEIVEGSGGVVCQDYLDRFRSFFHIWAEQQPDADQYLYVEQHPDTLPGTNCQTTEVQVETAIAGVTASITRSFQRCDNWDVTGYLENNATEPFGVEYENNERCSDEDRASAFAMIVQGPERPTLNRPAIYSQLFIDPEQKSGLATVC